MARRKAGSTHTTISITWEDKELFRRFAKLVKKTRNGEMYESDSAVFHKILAEYIKDHESETVAHTTYPTKTA
jgi:hypothetical protein